MIKINIDTRRAPSVQQDLGDASVVVQPAGGTLLFLSELSDSCSSAALQREICHSLTGPRSLQHQLLRVNQDEDSRRLNTE